MKRRPIIIGVLLLALAMILTVSHRLRGQLFGFFHPSASEQGVTLLADKDNIVFCTGAGAFPLFQGSLGDPNSITLSIHEYTKDAVDTGHFYTLQSGQLSGDLTSFQRGNIYNIHPSGAVFFRCGNGLSLSAQSNASSSQNASFAACPPTYGCTVSLQNNQCVPVNYFCGNDISGTCGTTACPGQCVRCTVGSSSSASSQ